MQTKQQMKVIFVFLFLDQNNDIFRGVGVRYSGLESIQVTLSSSILFHEMLTLDNIIYNELFRLP